MSQVKSYCLSKIKWDTDGESANSLGLPRSVVLKTAEEVDDDTFFADALSDRYGFCVEGLEYEPVDGITEGRKLKRIGSLPVVDA